MKQFAIIFTIAVALTVSIFAKASNEIRAVEVGIQSVKFDETTMIVKIVGNLPNLCTASPQPILKLTKDSSVLELTVDAKMHGDVCVSVAMVGGVYELAFDIRSLKSDIEQLKIDTNAKYKIIASNGTFVAEIDFSKFANEFQFATHQVNGGTFAVLNDGRYMIVVDQATSVEVRSPFINIKKYLGQHVDVTGFVVNSQKPVIVGDQIEKPLFLLTGLNTISH